MFFNNGAAHDAACLNLLLSGYHITARPHRDLRKT